MTSLPMTLPGRLRHQAKKQPNAIALREKTLGIWQEYTWREYLNQVAYTAKVLQRLGVSRGDNVAILADNCTQWLFADLGAQTIGACGVGIYPTNSASDVAYILSHCQAKVVVCEDQEQVDKVVAVKEQTPTVQHVLVLDPRGTRHIKDERLLHWDTQIKQSKEENFSIDDAFTNWVNKLDPTQKAMIVYTSGTTGKPKGAMLSGKNALSAANVLVPTLQANANDLLLSYLPLCHVAEKIFTLFIPLTSGSIVHFGESIHTVQQDIREVSPTIFLGVPRIWEKMNAAVTLKMKDSSWLKRTLYQWAIQIGQKYRHSSSWQYTLLNSIADLLILRPLQERLGLRRCRIPVSGAAPISRELLSWYNNIGVPIIEGYGMTECAGVSHVVRPNDYCLGSVGQALDNMQCTIAEDGEIMLHGPEVFLGYLHNPDATAQILSDDGWLSTGDLGYLDEHNRLFITGRKKEIIITAGGKNLSPEKIERPLKDSIYIKEAVSIGDSRKFISALIQIDADAVGDWASRKKITYTDFEDLSKNQQVIELITKEVQQANQQLARVEQIKVFKLFPKELHQDDGELTATQKVRRKAIKRIWSSLIEEMYR